MNSIKIGTKSIGEKIKKALTKNLNRAIIKTSSNI